MNWSMFISWSKELIVKGSQLGNWLITPIFNQNIIGIGQVTLTPLMLVSVGGILAFIGVAVIKWLIS